ncbi:uncharacterized protein SPAPADRAFT_62572 [Spathaspora passalidarum NRRL Y-27907]|uniref:Uncharacterized protein n=1 Tax=Spathaspora passalidarum (strain NRRL Y-27907 / 11-Y1) TaxID=619300 RepID=G3ASM1_SPAPN|nr:uncharacterized protein SPAPADRAFT_62572 [Spathaspora passalidarum NRRL Y-27907]EGW30707.1 hypothetical protein SPAPADRAFT_62572 [Spathaspora passalidarum NRRL Y-27907]
MLSSSCLLVFFFVVVFRQILNEIVSDTFTKRVTGFLVGNTICGWVTVVYARVYLNPNSGVTS